jgi:hypothetical protein
MLLAIPSFFDLIATILMNIGLLSVTASVYQMMRGAEMLFAALFAVTFLKRHLNKYHYLGILCCGVSGWGQQSDNVGGGGAGASGRGEPNSQQSQQRHGPSVGTCSPSMCFCVAIGPATG